tara:strand:- start:42 stop:518 length:477 start_codon:yes stop_codon:yes gene_type:complete
MLSLSKFEIRNKDLIIEHIQENAHRDQSRTNGDITRLLGGKVWQPDFEREKGNEIEVPLSWSIMKQEIEKHAKMKSTEMWSINYTDGQGCKFHHHDVNNIKMSAIYYLKVGDESGNLIFPDEGITIEPKENLFVMFDAKLIHGVEPSLDGRICVVMNF